MESLTLQPIARVDGTINLPGSKSVSNRALLLAALAHGKTVLTNLLDSDDVRHMLNALTALGVSYTLSADRTRCEIIGNGGPLHAESARELFLGENIDRFISKVRKYLDLDELTPALLNDMVKAVYVHAPDKSSGHREQQIDISYDLVGILPISLLADLQNGETT